MKLYLGWAIFKLHFYFYYTAESTTDFYPTPFLVTNFVKWGYINQNSSPLDLF